MGERTRRRRRLWRGAGIAAVLVGAAFALRGRLPEPAEVFTTLAAADPAWLLTAAAAQFVSLAMFARQQRRLLTGFGVTIPRHRAFALAYSRSAIAISLPAGSAVSAAYAFREFRADGADKAAATAVMVLSGLLSAAGLALLYVTGMLTGAATALARNWDVHPGFVLAGLVPVATLAAAAALALASRLRAPARPARQRRLRSHGQLGGVLDTVRDALTESRTVRPRHWLLALAAAVGNWLTDLLCLLAASRAVGIELGVATLATIYLTVQLLRQVPLTPGGIGVIEAALFAGLVSAGAADSPATAAVLTYRLLSCWLIIPIGVLGWLVLRATRRSDVVDRPLLDEPDGSVVAGTRLPQHRFTVGPRSDVGEQQSADARPRGEFPRLPPG